MTRKKILLIIAAAVGLAALAAAATRFASRNTDSERQAQRYLTQAVDQGAIRRTISASGALTPVNLVQVGTQVSGTIKALHVDFNSIVKVGQLLAEIDTAMLDAELAQSSAAVRSAQASLDLARTRHARNQRLFEQGYIARAEVDDSASGERTAQAALEQQRAALERARTNRRNAEIRSPVAGTVVSREVSVGQTVAASLQTPVLFKIAQDLREMQIETNVSEADVGQLREGQAVSFTVDAFPDRVYSGTVRQIRNNYVVQQNVVTYTAAVLARNDDLSLRPGMTGYVSVVVGARERALRLPNAALRYEPAGTTAPAAGTPANRRTVWRLAGDGSAQPVSVTLGLADNQYTELTDATLKAGDALVIGENVGTASFAPRIF
jgi:HlyD family secretion protein